MALANTVRPLCQSCRRSTATSSYTPLAHRQTAVIRSLSKSQSFRFASTSTSTSTPSTGAAPSSIRRPLRSNAFLLALLGLSLPLGYYLYPASSQLSPYAYSSQPATTTSLTDQHKLLSIPVPSGSRDLFTRPFRRDGTVVEKATSGNSGGQKEREEIVIQHMMIKSPDIQIERPYTPINDAAKDREVRMVVKRVRGGEVGRVVHTLQPGGTVGVRGPIPTFSLKPADYDRIVMISTGTGIAPFLQLLSKIPPPSQNAALSNSPKAPILHLVHSLPLPGRPDWVNPPPSSDTETHGAVQGEETSNSNPNFLPALQQKFGSNLVVTRPSPGYITHEHLRGALSPHTGDKEKILVLVCLPPQLMRPLCGDMTPNLDQGPLTGLLKEMGLESHQVFKLE